jgi:purine-binding chemotaxis protein CheW
MDILAARKKAAERAKAAKNHGEAEVRPALPDEPAELTEPAIPQVPEELQPVEEPVAAEPVMRPEPATETELEMKKGPDPEAAPVATEKPEQPQGEQASELEMLSFLLGSEEYVVEVERVKEVLTPREITPVPHTADYLIGVCSLRGTVMPVIDLSRRLGLAQGARDEKSRIIVVSLGQDDQVGQFVDRVRGVVRLPSEAVRSAPETVEQGAGAEFLKGIARKDGRLYILLDVEKSVGA